MFESIIITLEVSCPPGAVDRGFVYLLVYLNTYIHPHMYIHLKMFIIMLPMQ